MAYIISTGLGIPKYSINQQDIKRLVDDIFQYKEKGKERLLSIFNHAAIKERQFVVKSEWFHDEHSFEERNNDYVRHTINLSLKAMDHCLTNQDFLLQDVSYEDIDMIIFVSSTGIATPSLDVKLMNERPFREDVNRMPLWGLGCAGGAIGLSRAFEWVKANPEKKVLLVSCELCSLTFQKDDLRKSNFVGTALFGDGASAVLLAGDKSLPFIKRNRSIPKIIHTSSKTEKNSEDTMGWNVTNNGFEVIFSKTIPQKVHTVYKPHVLEFIKSVELTVDRIYSYIAHPGGRKVLEAMEESLKISKEKLQYSYEVLEKHGNVSSATVLYVLHNWLKIEVPKGAFSLLSALGPGFSSELLLLEWE